MGSTREGNGRTGLDVSLHAIAVLLLLFGSRLLGAANDSDTMHVMQCCSKHGLQGF